ncbi:uncharacterized protein LOC135960009 [Calliphora vicina]|uniref:uncharacterized protein LOC135960009 n=1 Tax=Calliphora vicina TaxID=7373 RepID=UPI00325B0151
MVQYKDPRLKLKLFNIKIHDVIRRRVTRGTPQGGELSPLLWLLAVNSILRTFESKGKKIVAYADDVVILIKGKFLSTISDIMQESLGDLSSWAKTNGLGVNPSKTELVLFTRKYKVERFNLPKLDGVEPSLSGGAKYLGTFLDNKLSWKINTQERLKKGLNAYYTCRNSIGKNWGLRPSMVNWIYTSVVRPIITYGCTVWWEAMRKRSYRAILNKAQRCACLGITGALGSTPQAALDIILNLLPIENYVESVAARNLLRLSESSLVKPLRTGHTMILYEAGLFGHDIIPSGISDYKIATFSFGASPPVEFPTRDKWVGSDQLFDGCAVFTDGSKMDSGTGAGVYLVDYDIKRSYRLSNECSVFQAEIFAIWKATELIKAHVNRGAEVTIYVDSQAALKALECYLIYSNLVEDCTRALEELLVHYSVRLCWVPGHCDIQGNEVADEQARHGSDLDHDTRERNVKPPICYYYRLIYEKFCEYTNQSWGSGTLVSSITLRLSSLSTYLNGITMDVKVSEWKCT